MRSPDFNFPLFFDTSVIYGKHVAQKYGTVMTRRINQTEFLSSAKIYSILCLPCYR